MMVKTMKQTGGHTMFMIIQMFTEPVSRIHRTSIICGFVPGSPHVSRCGSVCKHSLPFCVREVHETRPSEVVISVPALSTGSEAMEVRMVTSNMVQNMPRKSRPNKQPRLRSRSATTIRVPKTTKIIALIPEPMTVPL